MEAVRYDKNTDTVVISVKSSSGTPHTVDLYSADQMTALESLSELKWHPVKSGVSIAAEGVVELRDAGDEHRGLLQNVYRRLYRIYPAGIPMISIEFPEVEGGAGGESITSSALNDTHPPEEMPNVLDGDLHLSTAFTLADAEKFVAEEMALQTETAHRRTQELLDKPARRAWQLDRGGHFLILRELNEAPRPPHAGSNTALVSAGALVGGLCSNNATSTGGNGLCRCV